MGPRRSGRRGQGLRPNRRTLRFPSVYLPIGFEPPIGRSKPSRLVASFLCLRRSPSDTKVFYRGAGGSRLSAPRWTGSRRHLNGQLDHARTATIAVGPAGGDPDSPPRVIWRRPEPFEPMKQCSRCARRRAPEGRHRTRPLRWIDTGARIRSWPKRRRSVPRQAVIPAASRSPARHRAEFRA